MNIKKIGHPNNAPVETISEKGLIGNKNMESYLNQALNDASIDSNNNNHKAFSNDIDGLTKKIQTLKVSAETIGLSYSKRDRRCELYSKVGNLVNTDYFTVEPEEYLDLCKDYKIDNDSKYNYSGWVITEAGDLMRVFAVTPPISEYPNVTFNISRKPRGIIEQKEVMPHVEDIFTSNFLIVGASGSGKTYLLNNALKIVFAEKDNRIILVEEFHELFPPNKHTICLDIPPCKPGEVPVFDYVIAQTNLMRAQNIFVGEIKGKEAWPFVLNLASGTFGGCTMHGKSCEDGLARLQMLMTTAGVADRATCGDLISRAIKYVIYIEDHRVKDIKKVTGTFNRQNNKYQLENIL